MFSLAWHLASDAAWKHLEKREHFDSLLQPPIYGTVCSSLQPHFWPVPEVER